MPYVICYDVSTVDDAGRRRLRRVARLCVDNGRRVQKSVFECHLDAAGWNRLRLALLAEIDPDCDSLRVYHLHDDAAGHTEHYGCARPADMTAAMIA